MTRTATFLLTCLALAGCARPGGRDARADAATQAACRQEADRVYDAQNRGDIYSPQAAVNTPSSASYAPGADSRGLSQLFVHDKMIDDCVRRGGIDDRPPATAPGGR